MITPKNIREVPAIPAELWQGIFALRSDNGTISRPTIDWFANSNTDISYNDAILKATELVAYWKKVNNVPDFVEDVMRLEGCHLQRDVVIRQVALIIQQKNMQLLAGTGTGKTYMEFATLDVLAYYNYFEQLETLEQRKYPFACVYFTPKAVVDQTNNVKKLFPNISPKCIVINYESLRTKKGLGNVFIDWTPTLIEGTSEIEDIPNWRIETSPAIAIFDENQKLKNPSLQTKLCLAYLQLQSARIIRVLFSSATPFVRPIECKCVALFLSPLFELRDEYITKVRKVWHITEQTNDRVVQEVKQIKIEHIPRVKPSNFPIWLKDSICGERIKPTDYSPAAMERLTDYLSAEFQLVHATDVRFKHKTFNKHILIDFADDNERKTYNVAYLEYIDTLLKTNRNEPGGMSAIFVAMLKFRMAAELLRARHLAKLAVERVKCGNNVILATAFTETQDAIFKYLVNEFGIEDKLISKIRGGQSNKTRSKNVNNFQDETSHIILVMLQAGGVGLSLHQYDGFNKRPRFIIMPPVWSIIEMLQMLGRGHRINSGSTTRQWVVWYRGTIEESVYQKLQDKALSMRELFRKKEQWSDLFVDETCKRQVNVKDIYAEGNNNLKNSIHDSDESEDEVNEVMDADLEIASNNVELEDDSETVTA